MVHERVVRAVEAVTAHLDGIEFSGTIRISVGDDVLLEHASGFANRADRVPNEIGTRFGTASLTKSFTAASICRLMDTGAAAFDSRVVDILPATHRPTHISADATLHHLLTHTSGIADYYDEDALGPAAYELIWHEHPSYLFRRPADFLPLFKDMPALGPPGGTEGHYCNAGYIMLGLVIEELSGRPYIDYVEDQIFKTAGMNDSGFFAMDEPRERVAIGYIESDDGGWRTNHYAIPIVGGADGGAYTTVRDLEIFLRALEGGVFFGPEAWKAMSAAHVTFEETAYGYGMYNGDTGIGPIFGGAGADPGFSARALRFPEADTNVMMLGNSIFETDGPIGVWRAETGD
jgi:CubicO group peptidase (beta-lactamase class C family)